MEARNKRYMYEGDVLSECLGYKFYLLLLEQSGRMKLTLSLASLGFS